MEPNAEEEFLRSYAEEYAHIGWAEGNCPLNVSIEQGIREHAKRAQNGRINMQEPEVMARDIRLHLRKKEEQRLTELKVREFEELRDCTFQPSIEHSLSSLDRQRRDTSPVVIRGLGRHLELRHLSAKQKEDALQREKEVFSVKNVDKYRRAEDGSTLVQVRFTYPLKYWTFNMLIMDFRLHCPISANLCSFNCMFSPSSST
jgi:hypothetical protein